MAALLEQWRTRYSFTQGASRAGHAYGRSQEDLKKALAEVDGLFAGLKCVDKIDPSSESESPNSTTTPVTVANTAPEQPGPEASQHPFLENSHLVNFELDHPSLALDGVDSGKDAASPRHAAQWADLKDIRDEMDQYFFRCKDVLAQLSQQLEAQNLDRDIFEEFSGAYETAKELREKGILTFRDILSGANTPYRLQDIFAFASLSYVVSKLLHRKGKIEGDQILSGLLVWRGAIKDRKAKQIFDAVAKDIWPEAAEVMHFIPLTHLSPRHFTIEQPFQPHRHPNSDGHQIIENPQDVPQDASISMHQSSQSPMMEPVIPTSEQGGLLGTEVDLTELSAMVEATENMDMLQDDAFNFSSQLSIWHDFSAFQESPIYAHVSRGDPPQDNPPGIATNGEITWRPITQGTGSDQGEPSGPQNYSRSTPLSYHNNLLQNPPDQRPLLERLKDTILFLVVLYYMDILHETDVDKRRFLYLLSGRGMTVREVETGHAIARERQKFCKRIRKEFFNPRRRVGEYGNRLFLGLLAAAKGFVDGGHLTTRDEVQMYLYCVAPEILETARDATEFIGWVAQSPASRNCFRPRAGSAAPKPSNPVAAPPQIAPKRLPCRHGCGKIYKSYSSRRTHERSKHDNQPIPCAYRGCNYSNTRADNLHAHRVKRGHFLTIDPSALAGGGEDL